MDIPILWQFTFSHFNEKARWALDYKGIAHVRRSLLPGPHIPKVKMMTGQTTVPVMVMNGETIFDSTRIIAALDAPALNDRDDVAFLATVRRGRETLEAVYLSIRSGLRKVVAQGDPAPAGGVFAGFGPPALNGRGAVAFAAVIEGPAAPGGLFIADGGGVRMLVAAGAESPVGGIFTKFSERIALNADGAVAFTALLKGARVGQVVVLIEGGHARKVAALDEEAPGGGTFSHFGAWPSLSGAGAVGFTASVDHGPAGVAAFVIASGRATRVAALGDALPGGGRLASFGLYPVISLSGGGAVTFASAPTATGEGVAGLFTIPAVPR